MNFIISLLAILIGCMLAKQMSSSVYSMFPIMVQEKFFFFGCGVGLLLLQLFILSGLDFGTPSHLIVCFTSAYFHTLFVGPLYRGLKSRTKY